jgi:hypothetical protein
MKEPKKKPIELKAKLREIIENAIEEASTTDWQGTDYDAIATEVIAQIDQAYHQHYVMMLKSGSPYAMFTGQEWYERFEKEVKQINVWDSDIGDNRLDAIKDCLAAAKRASGLDV